MEEEERGYLESPLPNSFCLLSKSGFVAFVCNQNQPNRMRLPSSSSRAPAACRLASGRRRHMEEEEKEYLSRRAGVRGSTARRRCYRVGGAAARAPLRPAAAALARLLEVEDRCLATKHQMETVRNCGNMEPRGQMRKVRSRSLFSLCT
jgi:hypothetical protein